MRLRDFMSLMFSCKERRPRPERHYSVQLDKPWKEHEKKAHYIIQDDPDYIVYIDHKLDVQWAAQRDYYDSFRIAKLNNVITRAIVVETLPSGGLDYENLMRFKRLVGQAMVCCLTKQYGNGLSTLKIAEEYLYERTREVSRFWYLSSSIIFSFPFGAVTLGFWLARVTLEPYLSAELFWFVISGCCGAFGALLSVMSRTGKLDFSSSSGRCLHRLEAVSRLSVGALSAGIVNLAIQSKLFIPSISHSSTGHAFIVIAAIAAGASERLAPSIISQFDRKPATKSYEPVDAGQKVSQQTIPEDRATSTRSRRRPTRSRRAV